MTPLLEVEGLCVAFGHHDAVRGVSLSVDAGTVVALLGLNGAGKSVTAKAVAGLVPVRQGVVRLADDDITVLPPEARVRLGLRHLPQVGGVVPRLTVAENLRLGGWVVRRRRDGRYEEVLAGVLERFPALAASATKRAGTLSAGQQRMLALARALMAEPRVLLADEPSAGLAPDAVEGFAAAMASLRAEGLGVLLVEQNIGLARVLADEVVVLDRGTVVYRDAAVHLDDGRLASLLGLGAGRGW